MTEYNHIISFNDRHERIRNIADELDAYLEKMQQDSRGTPRWPNADRDLHKLRGYCEQLRCDAESLKNGADGFGKGVKEIENDAEEATR
tara:strand:+ start:312 stop:578 length:267 start_codon:yes stop_codon:yes gene_type:complete